MVYTFCRWQWIQWTETAKKQETVPSFLFFFFNYNDLVSFLHCSEIAPKYMFVVFDAHKCEIYKQLSGMWKSPTTQISRCFALNANVFNMHQHVNLKNRYIITKKQSDFVVLISIPHLSWRVFRLNCRSNVILLWLVINVSAERERTDWGNYFWNPLRSVLSCWMYWEN